MNMNQYLPEGALMVTEKNSEYISSMAGLERALEHQAIIEAPAILCDKDFNLHIEFPSRIRGIITRSEVAATQSDDEVKDIAILTRVGKIVCFKVVGFEERCGERVAILSRRLAQRECMLNYISNLLPGDIIKAKITPRNLIVFFINNISFMDFINLYSLLIINMISL